MLRNSLLFSSTLKSQFSGYRKAVEANLINSSSQLDVKRNSRVLRRRITRIENEFEVGQEEIERNQLSESDRPSPRIVFKNPRNLEQMLFEQKPLGWELDAKNRSFWNK